MARFLVVDDDRAAVDGMTRLLTEDGHDVAPFTEGAVAVSALATEPFDAILTDLDMPDTDGHEVVRAARAHHPHACVVVVSASAQEARARLARDGACIIVDKPVDYDEVARALETCRSHRGPGASGGCHLQKQGHPLVPLRPRRG